MGGSALARKAVLLWFAERILVVEKNEVDGMKKTLARFDAEVQAAAAATEVATASGRPRSATLSAARRRVARPGPRARAGGAPRFS